ncbi:hypothetical protein Hanom_Chr02g00165021 [Helianthus anomalus]
MEDEYHHQHHHCYYDYYQLMGFVLHCCRLNLVLDRRDLGVELVDNFVVRCLGGSMMHLCDYVGFGLAALLSVTCVCFSFMVFLFPTLPFTSTNNHTLT